MQLANPGSTAVKRFGSGLFRRSDAPEGERGRTRPQDITLHEHNLADWERVFGPEHPDTLNGRDKLARAYLAVGRQGEAIALLERNLACRQRVDGPDQLSTLAAQHALGAAYRSANRLDDAIRVLEPNLAAWVRVKGPEHRGTLLARSSLGCAYRDAGRLADAIPLFEQNLADAARVLPDGDALGKMIAEQTPPSYGVGAPSPAVSP
jgi:tetratricopeptide (TPR) repeat protein